MYCITNWRTSIGIKESLNEFVLNLLISADYISLLFCIYGCKDMAGE